jgi:hypothetical protein
MPLKGSKRLAKEIGISLLILAIIVVSHEAGHVLFGLATGHESRVVFISGPEEGLGAYGFATVFSDTLMNNEVRFIALGGVVFNAIIALFAFAFMKKTKNPFLRDFMFVLAVAGVMSVVLNSIPIAPFDGSRFLV